jgi:hypothetical protein
MVGQIRIVSADVVNEGVVIAFGDGTSVIYKPTFLYEHRGSDDNHTVVEDPAVADWPLGSL